MTRDVGIVRSDASLRRAADHIARLRHALDAHDRNDGSLDMLELRNLTLVADLIVRDASARRESRGAHFNRDWPDRLPQPPASPDTEPDQG